MKGEDGLKTTTTLKTVQHPTKNYVVQLIEQRKGLIHHDKISMVMEPNKTEEMVSPTNTLPDYQDEKLPVA